MGYHRPCGDVYIPSSWADHKNRTPPSSEPGTDYAVPVGTAIGCAEAGTVSDLKWTNSAATGRYVTVALDDGRTVRYLHLQSIYVDIGYRVTRGAILAASGASGNGSDTFYGPHVHTTLWPGRIWAAPTIDFELYAGDDEPPPTPEPEIWEDPDMDYYAQGSDDTSGRIWKVDMDAKTKRQLTPSEWATAQGAYTAAGGKAPLSRPTSAQLGAFVNVQAPPPEQEQQSVGDSVGRIVIVLIVLAALFAAEVAVDIYSAIQATTGG